MNLGTVYYLITVAEAVSVASYVLGAVLLVPTSVCLVVGHVENIADAKRKGRLLILPMMLLLTIGSLVPSKDDSLKIVALYYGDEALTEVSKDVKDFYPLLKKVAKKELEELVK